MLSVIEGHGYKAACSPVVLRPRAHSSGLMAGVQTLCTGHSEPSGMALAQLTFCKYLRLFRFEIEKPVVEPSLLAMLRFPYRRTIKEGNPVSIKFL